MSRGQILFVVNGLGLGNSTRCHALAEELMANGFSVDILTSSNGIGYFSSFKIFQNVYRLEPISYGSFNGKLSIARTLLSGHKIFAAFLKNVSSLRSLVRTNQYKCLIIDSDYTPVGLLGLRRQPVIAINNAGVVVKECERRRPLPKSILSQFWLEKLDQVFHELVPDLVISPQLSEFQIESSSCLTVPPIVRPKLADREYSGKARKILVMLSGSQFQTDLKFLDQFEGRDDLSIKVLGRQGDSRANIEFLGKLYDNRELINECDIMVINAGFSAVSEAFVLQKPAVIIPIENHAEQYINALMMAELGIAIVATPDTAHICLEKIVMDYESFRSASRLKSPSTNGVVQACKAILEKI